MFDQIEESRLKEFARSVELVASRFLEGHHRSVRGGQGQEYQEHLSYSEGEDAKFIDWKRWASSDRLLVRRFQEQKKVSWYILLDKSSSIAFGQKALFAKTLVGSFIYIADILGDQWKLDESSAIRFREVLPDLMGESFGGMNLSERKLHGSQDQRLFVVSDFFEDEQLLVDKIKYWQAEFKSVALLQILDPTEMEFPFESTTEFKDLESDSKMVLEPKSIKNKYLELMQRHQKHLSDCLDDKSFLLTVSADQANIFKTLDQLFEKL